MSESRDKLIGYVLGKLDESEQQRLEENCLADPDLAEEVWATWDDLADAFLRGELPESERQQFAARVSASPVLRKRLAEAKAFLCAVDIAATPKAVLESRPKRLTGFVRRMAALLLPQPKYAMAAIAVALLLGIAWLAFRPSQPIPKTDGDLAVFVTPTPEPIQPTPMPLASPGATPVSNGAMLATLLLSLDVARDVADSPALQITSQTQTAQLQLELPQTSASQLRATLQKRGGDTVKTWNKLLPRRYKTMTVITLQLPAHSLDAGDYVVKLSAVSSANESSPRHSYYFQVVRPE